MLQSIVDPPLNNIIVLLNCVVCLSSISMGILNNNILPVVVRAGTINQFSLIYSQATSVESCGGERSEEKEETRRRIRRLAHPVLQMLWDPHWLFLPIACRRGINKCDKWIRLNKKACFSVACKSQAVVWMIYKTCR